jgi:WD40 repeat-containing protein SMU1
MLSFNSLIWSSIIKIVAQFLKENGLKDTLKTLQLESGVNVNIIEDRENLKQNILDGKWDVVLKIVSEFYLPSELLLQLYELVGKIMNLVNSNTRLDLR